MSKSSTPTADRCACYARPEEYPGEPTARVKALLDEEDLAGLHTLAGHAGFAAEVLTIKSDLLDFLVGAAREGRSVAGYGAPGKGNTLLNHCGIREDLLQYTVDRSPVKQGKYLPGTHIPIYAPERLAQTRRTTCSSCRGICAKKSLCNWTTSGHGGRVWSFPFPNSRLSEVTK